MTGQGYRGFLRQLSTGGIAALLLPPYALGDREEVVIGRDLNCQIVLDPSHYVGVSRRHVSIRPLPSGVNRLPRWEICDLSSVNGTYINGECLQGCQQLQAGDRLELGYGGPQFVFECQFTTPLLLRPLSAKWAGALPAPTPLHPLGQRVPEALTLSQLFPIASTGLDFQQKAFLGPGVVTVVFVVSLFAAVGEPDLFNLLLAAYLAGAASFFVYKLCGKPKPWWVLLACALSTSLLLTSPLLPVLMTIFRDILPGRLPNPGEVVSFAALFVRTFFGAGLMEELLKALPVLGAYFLGLHLGSPWRERIGVWEPLDGILLGAASAVGFTLLETLGQYVPEIMQQATLVAGEDTSELLGLQLLIPRILGSVVGHMAYSGYLGYFIGLSVLKPHQRWQILGIGYISAAALHGLWNAAGYFSSSLLAGVGILSYTFLAAAILKARALSPTRE